MKCNYCLKAFNGGIFIFKHLVGTRYDSKPYVSIPKEIKLLMMKVFSDAKDASGKKKRLNNLEQIDDGEESGQSFSVCSY